MNSCCQRIQMYSFLSGECACVCALFILLFWFLFLDSLSLNFFYSLAMPFFATSSETDTIEFLYWKNAYVFERKLVYFKWNETKCNRESRERCMENARNQKYVRKTSVSLRYSPFVHDYNYKGCSVFITFHSVGLLLIIGS